MQNQSIYNPRFCNYEMEPPFFTHHSTYTQKWRTVNDVHYHSCVEIGLCTKGEGVFFIEDRIYPFSSGTIAYIPSGMLHIAQSLNESPSVWEYLFIDSSIFKDSFLPNREVITVDNNCHALFNMMFNEVSSTREDGSSFNLYLNLSSALAIALNRLCKKINTKTSFDRLLIMPAISYISSNYDKQINPSELAYQCHISESTLRRAFIKVTSMTPSEYIRSARMTIAENLLIQTTKSVIEISEKCGFQTISTFNRCFKSKNGISPSEFRKQTNE